MGISIVIGFRNREISRIKICLDSLFSNNASLDFELIFIDYGSKKSVSDEVCKLLSEYPFIRYYFSDTRGWFWNRAHALNTGLRIATGDVILFSDIDLIFPSNFISKILEFDYQGSFYTFSCYYLEKGMNPKSAIGDQLNKLRNHYVGLCAVRREAAIKIGGFNEYYMAWGGEDDELYNDLIADGNEWTRFSVRDFPVLHQWHPNHAPTYPTPWYLEMLNNLYVQKKEWGNQINSYGILIQPSARTVINELKNGNNFQSMDFMEHPLLQFNLFMIGFGKMESKQFGKFEYPSRTLVNMPKGRKDKIVNGVNSILSRIDLPYFIQKDMPPKIEIHSRERWLEFISYFIGKNRPLIKDYYLLDTAERLVLYFQKN